MLSRRWQAWILLFSLIAFLAAGCGGGEPAATDGNVEQVPAENGENHTNQGEQPQAASERRQDTAGTRTGAQEAGAGSNEDTEAGTETSGGENRQPQHSAPDGEQDLEISASDEPRRPAAEPSDAANGAPSQPNDDRFMLYGIAIGDSQASVTYKFGKPTSSLVMEDGEETLTVYRYDAFTVGFNPRQEVKFIEVTAELPDPGLGGIRLGSSSTDALRLLGEPDINTEYVLSYVSGGAVLKMDVDPMLQKITAIRLFSDDST